jgi:hypothetical protein
LKLRGDARNKWRSFERMDKFMDGRRRQLDRDKAWAAG